jgi:protein PET100, fungi type
MSSLHKSRQWLEAFKFAVYIATPVAAVYFLAFGQFDILERSIENRRYVVYPPEGPAPPKMRDLKTFEEGKHLPGSKEKRDGK